MKKKQRSPGQSLGKWQVFANEAVYRLVDLGRPFVFLVPMRKLYKETRGKTVEELLHGFLIRHFGAFTTSTIPGFGFWRDPKRMIISDECRQYEVSFSGKERVPTLLRMLAEIAKLTGEECIYCKAGQYACLIYPPRT